MQTTYRAATGHNSRDGYPWGRENWNINTAGAAPKLIASHRESSWAPNGLARLAHRAALPSSASKIMARKIRPAAANSDEAGSPPRPRA